MATSQIKTPAKDDDGKLGAGPELKAIPIPFDRRGDEEREYNAAIDVVQPDGRLVGLEIFFS